jgi:hypothetical protein
VEYLFATMCLICKSPREHQRPFGTHCQRHMPLTVHHIIHNNLPGNDGLKLGQCTVKFVVMFSCAVYLTDFLILRSNPNKFVEINERDNNHENQEEATTNACCYPGLQQPSNSIAFVTVQIITSVTQRDRWFVRQVTL